jgi:uncharacterized protein
VRERALELARGALGALEANRQSIDDLNVFPVADGDTGTNLLLTVQAVVDALEASETDDRDVLADEVTHAALLGARGNSGVILSQAIRGAADVLRDSDDLAAALQAASDTAYAAVREPVEGTMLTALRELADEAARGGDLAGIVARGDDCVARTTELLPVLKESGVVDAGAAGVVEIVRGIARVLTGEPVPVTPRRSVPVHVHEELSRFRYCTAFVVEGDDLDAEALERELEQLGDSLLVVGDRSALKAHVHTDDPDRALALGSARGTLTAVEVADMHEQTEARERRLSEATACAVVAVVRGQGNKRLFESLGATALDGAISPSPRDLLAAIEANEAAEAILLPNDRTIWLVAAQAAEHASKPVHVLETTTIQAGLAALVAFNQARTAAENLAEMTAAAESVTTGAVLARDGKWVGLAAGHAVAHGESFDEVARAVLERLLAEPRGLLTLFTGEEAPPLDSLLAELESTHPALEYEVCEGGQPHYPLLLSAE